MADSEIVSTNTTHLIPTPVQDVVVLARTPDEMAVSQRGLQAWAEQKLAAERGQLAETEENLAHAKRGKYQTTRWQRQVLLARNRVIYYEKILAALEAGYYIVPNFPNVDTLVIRTKREQPPGQRLESNWRTPPVPAVKADSLSIGMGHYVNPEPVVSTWTGVKKDSDGKEVKMYYASASGFADVDFPFSVVRPQILKDFNHALELRLFDEIGVLPARRRKGDPMVIGTIKRREGYTEHEVSFLISWWVDTRDL